MLFPGDYVRQNKKGNNMIPDNLREGVKETLRTLAVVCGKTFTDISESEVEPMAISFTGSLRIGFADGELAGVFHKAFEDELKKNAKKNKAKNIIAKQTISQGTAKVPKKPVKGRREVIGVARKK